MDEVNGVIAKEHVGSPGQFQAMCNVVSRLVSFHVRQRVSDGNTLIQRGELAELDAPSQRRLTNEQ